MMLAAIQPAPPPPDPLADFRGNTLPVDVPWPPWVWWAIGAGVVVALALLAWLVVWLIRRRPVIEPPSPRTIALRSLDELRAHVRDLDPYTFSIRVSDVLRTYVSAQFGIQATTQTSPEFLASISASPRFSREEGKLLESFLERCDMLKFARIEAHSDENNGLLASAAAFVEGART